MGVNFKDSKSVLFEPFERSFTHKPIGGQVFILGWMRDMYACMRYFLSPTFFFYLSHLFGIA